MPHVSATIEGVTVNRPDGPEIYLLIPHVEGCQNWARLLARLHQLINEGFPVTIIDVGQQLGCNLWSLRLKSSDVERFASALSSPKKPL